MSQTPNHKQLQTTNLPLSAHSEQANTVPTPPVTQFPQLYNGVMVQNRGSGTSSAGMQRIGDFTLNPSAEVTSMSPVLCPQEQKVS